MINNKEKKFISAVVYLYNNEKEVIGFIDFLNNILKTNFEKYEIICVNDASNDCTLTKLNEFVENTVGGIITVINMSFFQGLEKSMNAGLDLAIGDFIYSFDTVNVDYPSKLIMDTFNKAQEGFDIVSVSNRKEKLSSKIFYYIFNLGSANKIVTETFSIISRRAINRIKATSISIPYRKAVYHNSGLQNEIIFYESNSLNKVAHSESKIKFRLDYAITSIIIYTNHAYHFAMGLASIMMIATLSGVFYSIAVYSLGKPIEGYTTIMLVMTSSFFALFILLAIIIKYAAIILELVYKKQNYLIASVDKLSNREDL